MAISERPQIAMKRPWFLASCVGAVAASAALIVFVTGAWTEIAIVKEQRAKSAAKAEVLRRLKAPRTAIFDDVKIESQSDSDTFMISVTVDAQNTFGALIRNHFNVTLRSGNGDFSCEKFEDLNSKSGLTQ
jgi:hypothetical protein